LSYWVNGWSISNQNGKAALVDHDGNIAGGRYFDGVKRAETGDISKVLIDGHWKGIDRAGNIVDNPDDGRSIIECSAGLKATLIDGKVRITDSAGKPTTPYLFEPFIRVSTCDRPLTVKLNDHWGFIAPDGRLLFDPPAFTDVYEFDGGYALVKADNNKWGVIDTSGRFVIPTDFDKFLERRDGLYHLAKDGHDVWLNITGEERPAPPQQHHPGDLLDCGNGLQLFDRDGLWGIKDVDSTEVIAPRYRALDCFKNGVAWAAIDEQHQWCAIGPDGMLRDRPSCTVSYYSSYLTDSRPESFDADPYENSVLWVRASLDFGAGRRDQPPRFVGDRGP
jgi:hypothetical protein